MKNLICCFWILLCTSLYSQNSIPELSLYMSHLGVDEGLGSGGIVSVNQCPDGYLWVGTMDGLNRFDGYRVKTYLNEPGNSNSLQSVYIDKLFVDSRGWLWIVTRSGYLHLYDVNKDSFIRISTTKFQNGLFEDVNGDIWFQVGANDYNIIQVDTKFNTENSEGITFEDFKVHSQRSIYSSLPKIKDQRHIAFSKNNGIWIFNNDTLYNYKLKENRQGADLLFKKEIKDLSHERLKLNPNNDNILLCSDSEILIFDGQEKKQITRITVPKEIGSSRQVSLIDHKNRLWEVRDNGMYRLSLATLEWNKIYMQGEGSRKELLNYTKCIYQDEFHNIWIGTRGYGLFKHSTINEAFKYYGKDRLGPSIHNIEDYNDSSLIVSIANSSSAFAILDYKNGTITDNLTYKRSKQEILGSTFSEFFKDSQDRFWLPIKKAKHGNYKLLLLNHDLEITKEIESPIYKQKETLINHIFESENGEIWGLGSLILKDEIDAFPHVYLSKWSEEDQQFYIESVFENHSKDFLFKRCSASIETPDKSLWFGFKNGGLLNYNRNTKTWKHLLKKDSLSDNNYYNILSFHNAIGDHGSRFLLGTRSGMMEYFHEKDEFILLTSDYGIKDNVIYGILTDKYRNIWLSTNNGLSRYSTKTNLITNYSIEDGLQNFEFNRGAYFKREDSTLFFGGVGGLTWFNPSDLEIPMDSTAVTITGLKINNQSADSLLIDGAEIELPYDYGLISFEFAKINLAPKTRNQYVYKLEKNSKLEEWKYLGYQSSISLTKLSAGSYKLSVSSYDFNGEIKDNFTAITFSITKPWWRNNWLNALCIFIIVSIVYYVYSNHSRAKKKLEYVKGSISRDLHDEIGSTLSSISLFGAVAEKHVDSNPQSAKRLINQMNVHASESIVAMNDIVWTLKHGNDTIINLLNRLRYHFTELEYTGHFRLDVHCERKIQHLKIDILKLRNIYLILKEGVNNSTKYSDGNEITVRMYSKNEYLIIDLEDNGIGFNIENVDLSIANGLGNMKHRAGLVKGELSINSSIGKGTKIRLNVPIN